MIHEVVKKRFPFFEAALREAIADEGTYKAIPEGSTLIEEEQYIRSFPIILSGVIRVTRMDLDGNELLLYYLRKGEVCTVSLSCCVDRSKSRVRAIAEENSEVIVLPVELLDSWMSKYQTWKEFVMVSMRLRFDELLNTLDSVAFFKMDERLERFFIDRYYHTKSKEFHGSHQDIASSLGTSREVISRLLKQMEKRGLISLSRNRIEYSAMLEKSSS
ncbi:MAG TPA: Crp/Fnr family transcriptional regulator [Bacteroidales bacterium]|nr:Crp/Fnr family transcriptional regulator [Bacteroidales bacterium]